MVKTHGFPVELFQQNPQDWRLEASSTDLEGAVRQVDLDMTKKVNILKLLLEFTILYIYIDINVDILDDVHLFEII